jgi:hypothetical protein
MGGWDWEDLRPAQTNSLWDPISKITEQELTEWLKR